MNLNSERASRPSSDNYHAADAGDATLEALAETRKSRLFLFVRSGRTGTGRFPRHQATGALPLP